MLITRVEFAKKCNVTTAYITQYVKRKKIILTDNKMIDITNDQNFYFMQKRMEALKSKVAGIDNINIGIFDSLCKEHNDGPYNHEAEKAAVMVMQEAELNGSEFILYPKFIAFPIVTDSLIRAYEFGLKREISLMNNPTEEDIKRAINEYSNECKDLTRSCFEDLDNFIEEIKDENN